MGGNITPGGGRVGGTSHQGGGGRGGGTSHQGGGGGDITPGGGGGTHHTIIGVEGGGGDITPLGGGITRHTSHLTSAACLSASVMTRWSSEALTLTGSRQQRNTHTTSNMRRG